MIRLALRTKLTVWFAASILLILAPFLSGVLLLEWRSMRAALDHHLAEDLEVVTEMLVVRGDMPAWRADTDLDPGYDAGPQRWVEVYTAEGWPAFFRGIPTDPGIRAGLPTPAAATRGYQTIQTPAGAHVRTLTVQRGLGTQPLWIRVARAEDELRSDFQHLIALFAIGAPLAVLAAALAGHLVSGRMLAPLTRMADRARLISAERLSEHLPVENPQDELGRLAVVFNDTFARLDASFERLKQFTADVSHQLRTPLTAIRSVGEVGLRESRDPQEYREVIGSMLEEADRLSGLVDTLLTLSRWESGRVRPSPQPVDLAALVREVVTQLIVLAEERNVSLDVALDEPLRVSADPVMTRSAVMNVLDNAIKFTRSNGHVRITAASTPHEHHVIVDDEGPGIPADHRTRVFERFHRIEGDGTPAGSGLGLAIAHWAVAANHGRITIGDNDAGGARVVIVLPRVDVARS